MKTLQISPAQAAQELIKRRAARKSLISFTEYTLPRYDAAQLHNDIASALEDVANGLCDRLMILMPPRHGKSELASRRFPAWFMGKYPDKEIIAASYNSDLANDFGRDVRNIVDSQEYKNIFETRLAADSRAKGRWATDGGGGYAAVGVEGSATGRGADVFLIDDPVKDREEAESELKRKKVMAWYKSTAYTRLAPGGSIIVIQTRWHEDDLTGQLLEAEKHGGDQWRKLILPAIDENGEALWGKRYPVEALTRIKDNIGPRDWSALYQQEPTPDEGTFFQRDWFKRHNEPPTGLHIYGCSDYAVTDGGGDYTEHGVFGFGADGTIYELDWWAGQTTADEWIESKIDLMAKWKPLCWFGEGGVIQKAVEPMLVRRMRERRTFCRVEWVQSTKDKPTRARAIQSRAAMGKVSISTTDDGQRLLDQAVSFPAGKHDDAVDVLGLMGRVIDEAHPAVVGQVMKPKRKDRWAGKFETESESTWQTV